MAVAAHPHRREVRRTVHLLKFKRNVLAVITAILGINDSK